MVEAPDGPVCFVTASVPFSTRDEVFVQDEITAMLRHGVKLLVVPARLRNDRPNAAALDVGLDRVAMAVPLFTLSVLLASLTVTFRHPIKVASLALMVARTSGSSRALRNNLIAFPKALWLARLVRQQRVRHIHAYWFAHTATMAMVASRIVDVPWSASAYRWDIDHANCAAAKLRSAAFVRTADELGVEGITALNTRFATDCPVHLVRTGVVIPPASVLEMAREPRSFCCPGAFVPKKAQALTARAFAEVARSEPSARLVFYGEGTELPAVRAEVDQLGLGEVVEFHAPVPLEQLRQVLRRRPTTVLASIVTPTGEQEGIPVTLVEAMAHGSLVISTTTGSIANLLEHGECGLLVPPGDVDALVSAMRSAMTDLPELEAMTSRAYARVSDQFDIDRTASRVYELCGRG